MGTAPVVERTSNTKGKRMKEKTLTVALIILSCIAIVLGAGIHIGQSIAKDTAQDVAIEELTEKFDEVTAAMTELTKAIHEFSRQGPRFSLLDAERQYNESFRLYTEGEQFFLAKPSHQVKNVE